MAIRQLGFSKSGTRLGGRCRAEVLIAPPPRWQGRSGTHEQCGPRWLASDRIRILAGCLLCRGL